MISKRYLSGYKGNKLHNLTDIYSDLCQDTLFEPDQEVVDRHVADLNQKAKTKRSTRRRQPDAESSAEEVSDEEARDRAITFLMSVGEKRAYETKKRQEKEFMERFKVIFVTIVEKHLVNEARTMKVIDMTNERP